MIKGILEAITTSNVNLVNADLLAKGRGLRIVESTVPSAGKASRSLSRPNLLMQGGNYAVLTPSQTTMNYGKDSLQGC